MIILLKDLPIGSKVVTIKGKEHLIRLMTGSRHYCTNNVSIIGKDGVYDEVQERLVI